MTPEANDLCVFAVKRGIIEGRIDPHFYLPKFQTIINKIRNNVFLRLGDIAHFSKDTTDYTEFESGEFEYLEISGVSLGLNKYQTTKIAASEAPSRAKMKTQPGDIVIALTRPHRGAITIIKEQGIVASTGFSVIRDIDSKIDKDWLLFALLSDLSLQQMLQRSSGGNYPAIIEDEAKRIYLPVVDGDKQRQMVGQIKMKLDHFNQQMKDIDSSIRNVRKELFERLTIQFPDYYPSIYSVSRLSQIKEMGLYCNPHSAYLNEVYTELRSSPYYVGALEDYVEINPLTKRTALNDLSIVSFVPMPAVTEKTNQVVYEQRQYADVKTGFTPFQRGDLLWAKITPCMQNGKSFLSDTMPTEYGFGSTEFHVLRPKSESIYMPYLWILLSDEHILEAAQGMFSGSAGQQRVPDTFLKKLPIVLPPLDVQKELANEVFVAMEQVKQATEAATREWEEAKAQFERELLGES